ncbi:MAG: DNA polymerase I [Desulfarculus sp.]|nr:DNA polymerase I [Desulfarculus sp.]
MPKPPVLYLLDASSYIHRAFHAIRNLSTSQGVPTGAVFGFTQMLLKVMKDAQPQYLAVVYDAKGPTFRHHLYPAYKANRPPLDPALKTQMPLVRQLVTALNLPAVEMEGLEADDLMATLAARAVAKGFEVVLVSGDKDLFQLVSPRVRLWDTMKEITLGPAEVKEKLGVEPGQVVDYMALTGDSTDNVPGVPGVGPKTAASLIAEHGGLDTLLAQAGALKKGKLRDNLLAHRDLALLSRQLVRLKSDAAIAFDPEDFEMRPPDPEVLTPVLARLEFTKLLQEFAAPSPAAQANYTLVDDADHLAPWLEAARAAGRLSIDTETTSIDPMTAELVGLSLAVQPGQACYVPVGHQLAAGQRQASRAQVLAMLAPVLADPKVAMIGQNLKYDLTILKRCGLTIAGVDFDTMVASYLLNPGKTSHGLTAIAAEFLGRSMISYEEATGGKNLSFDLADLTKARDYAAEDADVALQAALKLGPKLKQAGLEGLFRDLEMPLVPLLSKLEMNGVGLDLDGLRGLGKELEQSLMRIEDLCYQYAGKRFNLNSPQQLGQVLFEDLGLSTGKKTKKKTGYSTDMSVLTQLAHEHPLPAELLNYRTLSKLKSTYVDTLPELVNPVTGRLHTSFNQAVTATGRLSSSDPNLQNIPVRNELGSRIRACFVPQPGFAMVSADYSQIELRVLAHLSNDPLLIEDMAGGLDVHTQTASRLFDLPAGLVTPEMRRRAKTVNFGVLYGMSAFRLAREQNISRAEAQEIIEKYLGRYRGIATFQQQCLSQAREQGYVTTLLGRRRFLPAINSSDRMAREGAERMALNTPIQGTAADIIKLAMLKVDQMMSAEFPDCLMILQVHDELVFECPQAQVKAFVKRVKQAMEGVLRLKVRLVADVGAGQNWSQAH